MSTESFENERTFSRGFIDRLLAALKVAAADDKEELQKMLSEFKANDFGETLDVLFGFLSSMCEKSSRPIVLIIDEVDSASNNQVFIDFLAQLRGYYLMREEMPTFHSVILAGVYDIKNLKLKLRPESEHQYNSPWNIAADFKINMNFSVGQIAGLLEEYESDHHTGMDIPKIAEEIYQYTPGYPVLVSSICKYIDEDLSEGNDFADLKDAWTSAGIEEAVKQILIDWMPLMDILKQIIMIMNPYDEQLYFCKDWDDYNDHFELTAG